LGGAPIPELKLPAPNPFIPKRLDVEKFDVKEKAIRPELLRDTSLSRLWYKRDDTWWLPKTNVDIKLTSFVLVPFLSRRRTCFAAGSQLT
jgi:insulysin